MQVRLELMPSKSAQLQIRISPAQKAALKRAAAAAGVSVSEFVLAKALPVVDTPLETWADAVRSGAGLLNTLSELELRLTELDDATLSEAIQFLDTAGLSDLQANCVAAAVEREARRRSLPAPAWTAAVRPMARPWFAWRLRSLRPHLMRISPVAYKRRGVYLPSPGDARQ